MHKIKHIQLTSINVPGSDMRGKKKFDVQCIDVDEWRTMKEVDKMSLLHEITIQKQQQNTISNLLLGSQSRDRVIPGTI